MSLGGGGGGGLMAVSDIPAERCSGFRPSVSPRFETETVWGPPGRSIVSHTHLEESDLMRLALGQLLFTYLSEGGSGSICLKMRGPPAGTPAMSKPDELILRGVCVCVCVRERDIEDALGHLHCAQAPYIKEVPPTQIEISQRGAVSLEVHLIGSFRLFPQCDYDAAFDHRDQFKTSHVLYSPLQR